MSTFLLQRSKRHRQRYQEIAEVFLRHGFAYLIERLGPEWTPPRRSSRSAEPSASPVTEQDLPTHFRQALEELGSTFVKLGQVLSTRPDLLPPAYVAELTKLQDAVPPVPWEAIRDTLTQELGRPPEEVFASINPEPLGAASLGQVHAATLANGTEEGAATPLMKQMDRLTTRLALSLLLAALTVSPALIVPAATAGSALQSLVTLGFALAVALLAGLFVSILKGTR